MSVDGRSSGSSSALLLPGAAGPAGLSGLTGPGGAAGAGGAGLGLKALKDNGSGSGSTMLNSEDLLAG
jgi:hypothetical protein